MTLLLRLCLIVGLAGLASGCLSPTAKAPGDVTPNAVTGDAIEVTALDAPATVPSADPAATAAAAPDAPLQGAAPPPGPEVVEPVPAPAPATDAAADTSGTGAEPPAEAAAEAVPAPPPRSEEQIKCERKRGTWAKTSGGLGYCAISTGDGGKRCTKESQCKGVCLARSGTCSPVDPLLGCNEVLQDNGARVTMCIE